MTDKTFTQAELDAAIAEANSGLEAKTRQLLAELKEARKSATNTPEQLAAVEAERDELRTKLTATEKAAKDATKRAEDAAKALESEQGAARSYALDAEINAAIAAGNIVPSLVPAFTALVKQQAKAELVDGKYAVQIGDKPAREYISAYLDTDDGKAFKAAPVNSGGGAQGGSGGGGGKTITSDAFNAMSPKDRSAFMSGGGSIVDQAA